MMLREHSFRALGPSWHQENSFTIFMGKVDHDVNAVLIWLRKAPLLLLWGCVWWGVELDQARDSVAAL